MDTNVINDKVKDLQDALSKFEDAYEAYALHMTSDDPPNYLSDVRDTVTICLQQAGQLMGAGGASDGRLRAPSSRAGSG